MAFKAAWPWPTMQGSTRRRQVLGCATSLALSLPGFEIALDVKAPDLQVTCVPGGTL